MYEFSWCSINVEWVANPEIIMWLGTYNEKMVCKSHVSKMGKSYCLATAALLAQLIEHQIDCMT